MEVERDVLAAIVKRHDAADLVGTGLEVFGLPFLEDAVQIPVRQEEQRALFMSVFFTGRRGSEVGGNGYERRYGGVRGDVPPGLLAALPIVPSTPPAPKRPLS